MRTTAEICQEWQTAIELRMAGATQVMIADRLGVHRNTVRNWLADPEFQKALSENLTERTNAARLRRIAQYERSMDRLAGVANQALAAAEANPSDFKAVLAVKYWIKAYRQLRAEERIL